MASKGLFYLVINVCLSFLLFYFIVVYCLEGIEHLRGKRYYMYNVRNVLTFPEKFANDKAPSFMVIGSSGVEAGFDTSQIEKQLGNKFRIYNGGMGGSVFSDNLLFLEYALYKGGKQSLPEMLICGVTYLNFVNQNVETQLIETLKKHTTFYSARETKFSLFSKYYHSMISQVDFFFWDRFRIKDFLREILSEGYKILLKIIGLNFHEPSREQLIEEGDKVVRASFNPKKFYFPNNQTRALYQVSKFCRDNNIQLVFIEMPESLELKKRYYSDNQREPYLRIFLDLQIQYPEVIYRGLRDFLSDDEFIDFTHSNKRGRERLSNYLSNIIKETLQKT